MRKKIKLGIFFILTIALFLISISILGNLKLKGNGYRIYVDYVFIGDLLVNGKVSYRGGGINIGFIENIEINPDGTIRVTLFITDRNVVLPEGTRFTIQTVGLGLGKGVEPFSLESALGSIGDIGKDLNFEEFTSIITNMSSTIELITKLINTNESEIGEIISNVNESIANISVISKDLSFIIRDVESGKGIVGALMKDTNLQTNVSQIISNLKIFSEKVRDNPSVLLFRETQTNK
ncbi:MAG: MCE family protein [Brachyspira sp.]|nr:MCE family protein [Brachyspira sp.]